MFIRRKTYEKLNRMIDDAISGKFEESDYDESELSKLEVKWKRFLAASKLSADRIANDREKIKELVTDISHQTKTPLANILLYSQLLGEQDLNDEARKMVDEIVLQSEKLETLIQSFVKTSRLETGVFQFHKEKNNVAEFVLYNVNQIKSKAARKNILLDVQTVSGIEAVFDKKWTGEALLNILDNSVKYSPDGSSINVSVSETELFVCIAVSDEGMGILEEEIPLIFQRFYRGRNACEQDGCGVGLYLARQIVEEQGGYIKVESVGNSGSTFKMYLAK